MSSELRPSVSKLAECVSGPGTRAAVAFGLASLVLAGGHLGPLSGTTYRALAAVAATLCALAVIWSPRRPVVRAPRGALLGLAAVTIALLVVPRLPAPEGPVAGITLVLGLLALARPGPVARHLACLTGAGLVLTAYTLLTQRLAPVWNLTEQLTRESTAWLGRLSGAETALGPSVAGLPVLLSVVTYTACVGLTGSEDDRRGALLSLAWQSFLALAAAGLGIPLLLRLFNLVSVALRLGEISMTAAGYPAVVAVYLPAALFAALLVPALATASGRSSPNRVSASPGPRRVQRSELIWAFVALLLAMAATAPTLRLPGADSSKVVSLLDRGLVQWDVPTPGLLGLDRAGMFGLLPRTLRAGGFDVRLSPEALSEAALSATDVVVVINPTESLDAGERARLDEFVRRGGGLVVLGDHTDIWGTMEPLNELLQPYGIAFRFDSAFTPHHWRNDVGFLPSPLTRGLDDANSRFQQSTGASLRVSDSAAPVATARWGFSDAGDRANEGNAFLGDYIYQAREPLGDLPVVALARHGRGRVIAFGDTSAFQNIAAPYAWPFLVRVFQVAGGVDLAPVRWLAVPAIVAWCLLALFGMLRPDPRRAVVLMVGTIAGLLLGHGLVGLAEPRLVPRGDRIALIDAARFNGVSLDQWADHSLSGLMVNLARNGFTTIVDREGDPAWLSNSRLVVTVAPRRKFGRREVQRLGEWMERGGTLLLAVGWEEKAASDPLLQAHGLDIESIPLGPVPVLHKIQDEEIFALLQLQTHFAEAWPVSGVRVETDELLYESDGFPIVVRRPVGRGALILIADRQFLLNKTLEEEGAAWPGNVTFLRRLLEPVVAAGGSP